MIVYISKELRSAYRLNGEELEYAPISQDNTFDMDAFDYVEPDLVGDELVVFLDKETNFYDAYATVTKILKNKTNKLKESAI